MIEQQSCKIVEKVAEKRLVLQYSPERNSGPKTAQKNFRFKKLHRLICGKMDHSTYIPKHLFHSRWRFSLQDFLSEYICKTLFGPYTCKKSWIYSYISSNENFNSTIWQHRGYHLPNRTCIVIWLFLHDVLQLARKLQHPSRLQQLEIEVELNFIISIVKACLESNEIWSNSRARKLRLLKNKVIKHKS